MDRKSSILLGSVLVLAGLMSLVVSAVMAALGFNPLGFVWRMWPILVIGAGLAFVVPPFVARGKPGLGALYIPGFPILTIGGILFLASIFNAWGIWEWLWPMLIISLAMGFVFAAVYMRNIWLLIPAIIIGFNGLLFQFCTITGLWHWWAVLWTIEPLSVGLALLVVNIKAQSPGLRTAGFILCGIAASMTMMMLAILGAWLPIALVGPSLLILAGAGVIAWGILRPVLLPKSALE
jgi:hypothetical protein